ncbi:gliding motility-associated C-terminal domain-containing protein [Pontibacter toksunensis]|uniref:Gliding motility-associated C-terminal domain-containing protein n=1 Tax=Pontibacter toksunensis TaxID=1332631 RepID=A0ABW6BZI1_9BACT
MIEHLTQRLILLCAVSLMGLLQLGVTHNLYAQTSGGACGPTDVELEIFAAVCGRNNGYFRVIGVTGGTAPYMYARNGTPFQVFNTFGDLVTGEYTITVKDAKGCTYTETVMIGDARPTDFTATASPATCTASNGQVTVTDIVGGASPYKYSKDGGTTFQISNVLTGLAAGSHQIVVKDRLECTVVKEVAVAVAESAPIQATVTPLTQVIGQEKTGSATLSAVSGGTAPYTYQLDGGSFTAEPALNNLGAGTHTLVVKDSFGCTAEISFMIESITEVDIPDGFTPNGDGINDLWAIKNLSILFPNCKVMVFNRWGSLVFESKGYSTPWDGTHKGKMLPDGTYYSIIEFGAGTPAIKKSLTIMR